MSTGPESFVALDEVTPKVIDNFAVLLSELSTSFAKKTPDAKHEAIERNLTATLQAPESTVLVYRDTEGQIVASATGNIVLGHEGWVDDVVTLSSERGKGLGRKSMEALHDRFRKAGVTTVRLTSSFGREAAGNLYADMGYAEGGTVWRAPLNASSEPVVAFPKDPAPVSFEAVNCPIPTGDKAWIYGNPEVSARIGDIVRGLEVASQHLRAAGIESANYFATSDLSPELTEALNQVGFAPRATRLYTLSQQ